MKSVQPDNKKMKDLVTLKQLHHSWWSDKQTGGKSEHYSRINLLFFVDRHHRSLSLWANKCIFSQYPVETLIPTHFEVKILRAIHFSHFRLKKVQARVRALVKRKINRLSQQHTHPSHFTVLKFNWRNKNSSECRGRLFIWFIGRTTRHIWKWWGSQKKSITVYCQWFLLEAAISHIQSHQLHYHS